jgi:predicted AlkP superfamily pyrophosphatase or phosphodiesterase
MLLRYFILLLSLFYTAETFSKTPVVLISIDGFAYHYLQQNKPQTLLKLAKQGSYGPMLPVFPSKTFPNHLSIITGLYPIQHGILHNKFYRRDLNKTYHLGAGAKDSRWLFGKPLWVVAQEHGLKTAIYFWPESEAEFNGVKPTTYFPYNKAISNQTRVDQMIDWLAQPEDKRPDFIASYFSIVDTAGHEYGPSSTELAQSVEEMDRLIAQFVQRLPLKVNLLLVSDHGMLSVDKQHPIKWQKFISDDKELTVVDGQTQLLIYSQNIKKLNQLQQQLSTDAYQPYFQVYDQQHFPSHWHWTASLNPENNSLPNLVLDANPPYVFSHTNAISKGTHGYDVVKDKQLSAFFIGIGPDIQHSKTTLKPFSNLAVFPLVTKLLGIKNPINIVNDQYLIENILK